MIRKPGMAAPSHVFLQSAVMFKGQYAFLDINVGSWGWGAG